MIPHLATRGHKQHTDLLVSSFQVTTPSRHHCELCPCRLPFLLLLKSSLLHYFFYCPLNLVDEDSLFLINLFLLEYFLLVSAVLQSQSAILLSRFSRVQLCVTPWTVAHQAPLCMGFSRQEYWSG